MVRLLEALTVPCIPFDSYSPEGSNTVPKTDIAPETWYPWDEFNYHNITTIFETQLATQYHGQKEPRALAKDIAVHDEESVDDGLRRFRIPIVNYALDKMPNAPHYGRGTRCHVVGSALRADWSCISDEATDQVTGAYLNLVPGDTKISSKWMPELHDDERGFRSWQDTLAQTVNYSAESHVRYGFVVTDTVLVVFRIARQYTGKGLAAGRPLRYTGYNQSSSDISMGSSESVDPSVPSSASYVDNNPTNWDFHVQYKTIQWDASGRVLTPNLALWALAMMSLNGDNDIDYSYPDLNTWRTALPHEGGGIKHNTSGATRSRASNNQRMQERNPHMAEIMAAVDGDADAVGEDNEEGQRTVEEGEMRAEEGEMRAEEGKVRVEKGKMRAEGREAMGEEDKEDDEHDGDDDDDADDDDADDADDNYMGGNAVDYGREWDQSDYGLGHSGSGAPAPKAPRQLETITVGLRRQYGKYYYYDYKQKLRHSVKKDWEKVEGGYLLRGKSHNYFAKKLP